MSGVPSIVLALTIFTCLIDRLQGQKAQLTTLTGQLLQSQDEERRRLARELHDSLGQKLAALGMNLGVVEESAGELDARAKRALGESLALTRESMSEIRTLAYLLHPPELDELGLLDAVNHYVAGFVQRSGIAVDLKLPADSGRLPRQVELAVFRVLQEGLNNIHRHSGANRASVEISRSASAIKMKIVDAGRGVQEDTWPLDRNTPVMPGVGIAGMRERIAQLGGRLEIRSTATGTTLEVFIPSQ
jgi:signal transduction histidine kinase